MLRSVLVLFLFVSMVNSLGQLQHCFMIFKIGFIFSQGELCFTSFIMGYVQYLIPSSSWMYSTWCPSAPLHYMDCIDHVGDEFVYCLIAAVCSIFSMNGPLHCLESGVFIDHVWLQLATVASLHCLSCSCIILSLYCHVLCSTFWTCALLHCLVSYFDYVLYCYALLDCSTVQHFCSR